MKDVVSIGGIDANDNFQVLKSLDVQLELHLAGHVDLNVRVGGLKIVTAKVMSSLVSIKSVGFTIVYSSITTSKSTLIHSLTSTCS